MKPDLQCILVAGLFSACTLQQSPPPLRTSEEGSPLRCQRSWRIRRISSGGGGWKVREFSDRRRTLRIR